MPEFVEALCTPKNARAPLRAANLVGGAACWAPKVEDRADGNCDERSGLRFFYEQMTAGVRPRKNAESENLGDDDRRLARTIDTIVRKAVGR